MVKTTRIFSKSTSLPHPMNRISTVTTFVAAFTLGWSGILHADDPVPQTLKDGISLRVGDLQVDARVASLHSFRLGVRSAATTVKPVRSVYLVEQAGAYAPFRVLREGASIGVATNFGKLLIDPARRMWSLQNPAGGVLTDWSSLGEVNTKQEAAFEITVGGNPTVAKPRYYGSGTEPDRGALTQREGRGKTDNGTATLPQYWSTAGYGLLVVGSDDDKPGTWKADDQTGAVHWRVSGDGADFYLCPAPDLYTWLRADAELTGYTPVPPLWAFGYMQSRWGWKDRAYISETLARFRKDQLPVDAFIIDFEWYTAKPDYTVKSEGEPDFADFAWNPQLFPDPRAQIAELAREGVHLMGIRKPRLGNSANLKMARAKQWIVPSTHVDNGSTPMTRDLDYAKPEVRTWWDSNNRRFLEDGMAAFWNDEGELKFTEYYYWNLAEAALQQQVHPGKRFWSLNRSYTPGLQRLGAAVWTGDYDGTWQMLARQPGEILGYSLAGMPYTGCDNGGMYKELSPELFTRWMQASVFFPVMRSHSGNSNTARFPWLYGPEAEAAIRKALNLRYRLIPYYYSLAYENTATAAPLTRPLAMEFPGDEKAATLTDEWLMGKGVLAAPLLNEGGSRAVYLPEGQWFEFDSSRVTEGAKTIQVTAKLDEIPTYIRAGTLLPLGPVRQFTSQPSGEPLELQIYGGRDATGRVVEDDGENIVTPSSPCRVTNFSWNENARTLTWKATGDSRSKQAFRNVKAVLYTPQGRVEKQSTLGDSGSLTFAARP